MQREVGIVFVFLAVGTLHMRVYTPSASFAQRVRVTGCRQAVVPLPEAGLPPTAAFLLVKVGVGDKEQRLQKCKAIRAFHPPIVCVADIVCRGYRFPSIEELLVSLPHLGFRVGGCEVCCEVVFEFAVGPLIVEVGCHAAGGEL